MARDEWEDDLIEVAERVGCRAMAARVVGIRRETTYYHSSRDQTFAARLDAALRTGRERRRTLGPWLLLLALALPAPLAAIESPPFALGSTGLSLTVRLRQWTEATGLWADVSAAAVDVVEEGNGEYSLHDLPAATGTDRKSAAVALASDPNRALFIYTYGAQPGTRLVFREEIALPSTPLVFRRGDSYGSLSLVVTRGLPADACEPETTATMDAANATTGTLLFDDRAATITNCEEDQTSGTFGATVTADLTAADLDEVGKYIATAQICYAVDSCQTLPSANLLRFEVVRRLGD